jgi:hypothetical protein
MTDSTQAHDFLRWAQLELEEFYGAQTGLDVRDFVRTVPHFEALGLLHIEQNVDEGDINLALLLDRDMFSAWQSKQALQKRSLGVLLEETSHFVYLGFNHQRGRNISHLEMELQSEVDRIVLAFHPQAPQACRETAQALLEELHESPYTQNSKSELYETARRWASLLLRRMGQVHPSQWNQAEASLLRKFFHLDLSEKIHLLRSLQERTR